MSMTETTPPAEPESEGVRQLREANERLKAKADAGEAAQRELAFLKAGIPTDEGTPGALLVQAYQGDLTPEAIAAEAAKYGITPGNQTPPPAAPPAEGEQGQQQPPVDPGQTQIRRNLGADSGDPGTPPPVTDPLIPALNAFREELANGATVEDAAGLVYGALMQAAREGNERFIFDAADWQGSEAARSR